MPSEPEMETIHKELLVLLKKFNEICVANGIKYSLHGGTLLGAIREKGFIPWDNDADVTMLRTEYEKFYAVMTKRQDAHDVAFDGCHRVPRLILPTSGTFLDIFIYDPMSEYALSQKGKRILNMFLRALVEDRITIVSAKVRNKYPAVLYWGYSFLQLIGSLLPQGVALRMFNKFNMKCFCGSGELIIRSNDCYLAMVQVIPTKAMSRYEMAQFEDTELMVSSDYDHILTSVYGADYMVPKKYDAGTASHKAMTEFIKNQAKGKVSGH